MQGQGTLKVEYPVCETRRNWSGKAGNMLT